MNIVTVVKYKLKDGFEHAADIQWYVGLAANYTTIFEAFYNKD